MRRTALGTPLVHDPVSAISAADRLARLDLVFGPTVYHPKFIPSPSFSVERAPTLGIRPIRTFIGRQHDAERGR